MTKENALVAYKHFRDLENNYEPREGMDSGPTSRTNIRERAKKSADNILIRHPEFKEEEKPVEEKKETKSGEKKDAGK